MRRGLAGLLGLPEGQLSVSDQSGEGSSPLPAADCLGQQGADQQQAAPCGLRRHGSGIPLPPPPALDASLVRSLSGVPCPPSPTKPPSADGLARQLSGLPLTAALGEAAAAPKTRKRARTARTAAKQAAAAAPADDEADEPMGEAEQKRQARLMKNRQTAAASRQRRLDRIAFLEARVAQLESVLGQHGIPVPEPLEGPKAAAPTSASAPTSSAAPAPLPAPVPLYRGGSLPANFSLAAAAAAGPLARQASLPLNFGAGFGLPRFELPTGAAEAAAAAAAATALFTPPSQVQQQVPQVHGAPIVPTIRQAPMLVPQPAQLDLPSAGSGALPWLTPVPASAVLPPPAAPAVPAAGVSGAPVMPQPLIRPVEAASRAAVAAATVAAMPPEQKAAFLARLQQLHPEVLPQLAAQRSAGGAGGASVAVSAAPAPMPMLGVPAVKQEAAEAPVGPAAAPPTAAVASPRLPLLDFGSPLPLALGTGHVAPLSSGTLAALLGSPPSPLLLNF